MIRSRLTASPTVGVARAGRRDAVAMMRVVFAMACAAALLSCADGKRSAHRETPGGGMITAVRAFQIAHDAIAGKRCHNAPCDVAIERDGNTYTVAFSSPGDGVAAAPGDATRVQVDASGAVRDVRNARDPQPNARLARLIPATRALEIGFKALRESGVQYDDRWTTTIKLVGDRYHVTFPLPEEDRRAPLRSDYALLVGVDSRTGNVVELLGAS
jgi:hypothetical protein